MVLEAAGVVELQRLMTSEVDCGESQVQRRTMELVEVLHLIVKEREAELFVLVERRRVVHVRILLVRRREIRRYSIATHFPSAATDRFSILLSDILGVV